MHVLDAPLAPPSPPDGVSLRLLEPGDSLDHLPSGLRHEMKHALPLGPVGVAIVEGRPVSFCYAVWTTEGLWDVSIDTLEGHRGRGIAEHVVRFMTAHFRPSRREPVWGALASNRASLRLAAKLGFRPVDEIVVFSKGPWAYLTGGFQG
jgi:RimJ/RimL family protein N-acetyltransferase